MPALQPRGCHGHSLPHAPGSAAEVQPGLRGYGMCERTGPKWCTHGTSSRDQSFTVGQNGRDPCDVRRSGDRTQSASLLPGSGVSARSHARRMWRAGGMLPAWPGSFSFARWGALVPDVRPLVRWHIELHCLPPPGHALGDLFRMTHRDAGEQFGMPVLRVAPTRSARGVRFGRLRLRQGRRLGISVARRDARYRP